MPRRATATLGRRTVSAMPAPRLPVGLGDVEAAAARISGSVLVTPSARSETLSAITGADVVVKFENLQFTASFKERGACNRLLLLTDDERARGVLAVSAGNHAQAVAYHAQRLGIPCTIVMPASTPWVKVTRTEACGARVVLEGDGFDEAHAYASRLAEREGLTEIPPFDDPEVIAGQGTVALEMLQSHPDLDVLLVPVGGGGLVAGMAVAAKAIRPTVEVVGVQSSRYPALARATPPAAGDATADGVTIAEGIAVKRPGVLTRVLVEALVDDVIAVSEARIEEAMSLYVEVEKVVAEGAGAAALAALLELPGRFAGRRVGLVLSGGNVDPRLLAQVLMRSLARSARLTRLTIEVPDAPGALARVAALVGDLGVNIISVSHDRYRPELALKSARLDLMVETRDSAHRDQLVRALSGSGFAVRVEPVEGGEERPISVAHPCHQR